MYRDEYRGGSRISYDGELIDLQDASYRLKRDRARERMYDRAENQIDKQQIQLDEVGDLLDDGKDAPWFDASIL